MRIDAVELRVAALPLVEPFATAHGTVSERPLVLVRVLGPDGEGWGECAALAEPTYTSEYADGAIAVLRDHLVPRLLSGAAGDSTGLGAEDVAAVLGDVVGHPMAKAALELAVLDAEGRRTGSTLAQRLVAGPGRFVDVPGGVAIGLCESPSALAEEVGRRVAQGYARVKIKIAPGLDVDHARAARDAAGPDIVLLVDANGAYRLDAEPGAPDDARRLLDLDGVALAGIEQPLAPDALLDHAELARRMRTPICLDESLSSMALTAQALDMGACSVVCVKAPRYGSWLGAAEVLDHCLGNGVAAYIGGMLDGGFGRAANLALAAHPACTLPGDISATDRFFTDDVTDARRAIVQTGPIRFLVPSAPGIGATVDPAGLARLTRHVETVTASPDETRPRRS